MELSKEIYFKEILNQMPRILGLMDRDIASGTYGCFDRQHWNYAVSDIAQARKQEAVLTLALIYTIKRKDNPYYENKNILRWINAALDFWRKIQDKNGSFNDLYPNEHSFVATAFSSYAVSETLLQLNDKIQNKGEIISSLKKAARFLNRKRERKVINQECGAIIFFHNMYLLTGNSLYKKIAQKRLRLVKKEQSGEGWFQEYGGADIGYLSLAVDYLAKYYKKTKDEKALEMIKKAVNFLAYFVNPDCTFGGIYGSRNTEYLVPSGFEMMAELSNARMISYSIRKAAAERKTQAPFSFDDKYLLFYSYNYLQAYLEGIYNLEETHFLKKSFSKMFEQSGIFVLNNEVFYIAINCKKGGALKVVFKKAEKVLNDCGIVVKGKKTFSSSWNSKNDFDFFEKGVRISGNLWIIKEGKTSPIRNLMLRLFQLTFGRSEEFSAMAKDILRDRLILNAKKSPFKFSRSIRIEEDFIEIIDEIDYFDFKKMIVSSKSTFVYGESSNYFQESDLDFGPIAYSTEKLKNFDGKIRIMRKYSKEGGLVFKISKRS